MSRKEATYAARVWECNVDAGRQPRGVALVDDRGFFNDVRFGARMLRKNPGFTAIAVFTLALGIAANATIFSFLSAWMLKKPAVSAPDRLMVVYGTNSNELREVNRCRRLISLPGKRKIVCFPRWPLWAVTKRRV